METECTSQPFDFALTVKTYYSYVFLMRGLRDLAGFRGFITDDLLLDLDLPDLHAVLNNC